MKLLLQLLIAAAGAVSLMGIGHAMGGAAGVMFAIGGSFVWGAAVAEYFA